MEEKIQIIQVDHRDKIGGSVMSYDPVQVALNIV